MNLYLLDQEETRDERVDWSRNHNVFEDPICKNNCLDVCLQYNKKCHNNLSTEEPGEEYEI